MSELDRIFEELTWIAERLDDELTPEERHDLTTRRDDLRRQARTVGGVDEVAVLRTELAQLEAEWDRLRRTRIDVVKQAGGSPGGDFGFATDAMQINRAIDAAGGREDLERRIKELRARLESM